MSNLVSRHLISDQGAVFFIAGDNYRSMLRMHVSGNKAYDLAFVPKGSLPVLEDWLPAIINQNSPALNIASIGDTYIRSTANNAGLNILSDAALNLVSVV